MNALQKKAILDALKQYGTETWAELEKDAAEANMSVEDFLAALKIAVPAGPTSAPAPVAKPAKPVAPAPVVVDNSARIAELNEMIAGHENAIKIMKGIKQDTTKAEAELTAMKAELTTLTGKPAKKAERPQLPAFAKGMVLGEDAGEAIVYIPNPKQLWAMVAGMRFSKGQKAYIAHGERAGVDYSFYWARFPDETDWSEFILDGLFEPDADGNRGPCKPFMVRSLAPDKAKGLKGRVFIHKMIGREFPVEGTAIQIGWTFKQEPAQRWVVTGEEPKPYKVAYNSHGPESENEVELPSHVPASEAQVRLPKASPRGK